MAYWLMKSEPETWSWDDQVKAGGAPWDGIRNHQAANYMKAMTRGDLFFFYHTGLERRIVGVGEIVGAYRRDPSDESGRFGMVLVRAKKRLKNPVSLSAIKDTPALAGLALLRQSRLSVMPVTKACWDILCEMAATPDKKTAR